MSPFLADRVGELKSWDDVKLLSVTVDRLEKWWRPGLLCIGDAAHAMSPIGGVGINMAVQDAVAAANRLAGPLSARHRDRRGPSRDPGSPHVAGALHAVAAAHYSEAGHQPRAQHGQPAAAEAAAVLQVVQIFSSVCAAFRRGFSASVSGPSMSTRRRLPCADLRRFSFAAAIPRRCGREFQRGCASASASPSRRLPTVFAQMIEGRPRPAAAASADFHVRRVPRAASD